MKAVAHAQRCIESCVCRWRLQVALPPLTQQCSLQVRLTAQRATVCVPQGTATAAIAAASVAVIAAAHRRRQSGGRAAAVLAATASRRCSSAWARRDVPRPSLQCVDVGAQAGGQRHALQLLCGLLQREAAADTWVLERVHIGSKLHDETRRALSCLAGGVGVQHRGCGHS